MVGVCDTDDLLDWVVDERRCMNAMDAVKGCGAYVRALTVGLTQARLHVLGAAMGFLRIDMTKTSVENKGI